MHNLTRTKYPALVKPLVKRLVTCVLLCLCSGAAVAVETLDPFDTEALLPPKPATSAKVTYQGLPGNPSVSVRFK